MMMSKSLMMASCLQMSTIFGFRGKLEQSESRIPNAWSMIYKFLLIILFLSFFFNYIFLINLKSFSLITFSIFLNNLLIIIFIIIFYLKKMNIELKNLSDSPDIIGLKKGNNFAYFLNLCQKLLTPTKFRQT